MTAKITTADLENWLRLSAEELSAQADTLTALDSAIGDADHGTNMTRGFSAVVGKLDAAAAGSIQQLLKSVGMTLVTTVGGASGSLYGTFFLDMGRNSPDAEQMSAAELETALRAGVAGVIGRGHAQVGDKTMVDALDPAVEALSRSLAEGMPAAAAVAAAADAARRGSESTEPLVARKGRASYLGARSAGHVDPGSASAAILVQALSDVLRKENT